MTTYHNHRLHRTNPFFEEYSAPPFNRIADEDFEPAIMRGIAEQEQEIAEIVNSHSRPTFYNTIARLDESGLLLEHVTDVFYNLLSAASDDKKEALATKFAPLLSAHHSNIMLNEQLFLRVKYVYQHHTQALTAAQLRLIEKTYLAFKRCGAKLKRKDKELLRKLTTEASTLTLQFQTNLLHARKQYMLNITNREQLDGVPDNVLETAAATAKANNETGWTLTLDEPVYFPILTYCHNRELRHTIYYMAYHGVCLTEGENCNISVCTRLINVRREIAQLLGYNTYADYVLEERMAGNIDNVRKFLDDLITYYRKPAEQEVKAVEEFAKKTEGNDFTLCAWDFAYYSHKLKLSLFDIDSEMLRPYFELSRVKSGVFSLAEKLYGITFSINPDIPVYADGVVAYDVFDKKNRLGTLYLDFHPRKGKQGGAWMTTYGSQYVMGRKNVRPFVAVVMNFTQPTPQRPSLLTLGEVTTFLHEFGHSLHALFSNCHYRSQSGTNVYWDFVELPSQIMENFAVEKDFLRTFAQHYKTGEPLPDELIDKIVRSRNFNVAYATMRQVAYGLLDMAYYTLDKPFAENITTFEREAMQPAQLLPEVDDTCMTVQFGHIMSGGYAAGYYSYKWAELLDADAFSEFKAHGTISRETGNRFRNCILQKGDTEPPMELYKRFRGKEPSINAMLERDGIACDKA